jgi:SAM-dependent methyltransferase
MSNDQAYLDWLAANRAATEAYHRKGVNKTEQQKALERLLVERGLAPRNVADIACGGGALSFHLARIYPSAAFSLRDLDPDAMRLARELNGESRFDYLLEDINDLRSLPSGGFDLVCCWQTLSWVADPERVVAELCRITAPGGRVFASSLFNIDHDVDIRSKVLDHTRGGGGWTDYNTFSARTVDGWLKGRCSSHALHAFHPEIDLVNASRGIGTFTVRTDSGRLQVSGGLLLNWAILEIVK